MSQLPILPNEMIDRLSQELTGKDLFHFTLAYESYLAITNHHLLRLLCSQSSATLDQQFKPLIGIFNSPYMVVEDGISLILSSKKWNNFVYGSFKIEIIEKSLKYYSTPMFFLYCRLWSFTPFFYEASYPTLNIFEYSYLLQSRQLSVDECHLFAIMGNNQTPPNIVNNLTQFIENYTCRYEYDVWKTYVDWELFVIAGGSVLSSLLVQSPTRNGSDVDLFFLKENPRLFERAVNELQSRLQNKYFIRRKTIWSYRLVQFDLFRKVTIDEIFNGKDYSPSVIIQLIHPTITPISISRILHSFDLDVCAAAFDSQQVIISFACLQALNSGHTTCYAMPNSRSEIMRRVPRLCKYQKHGFNILYPKTFDIETLRATTIEHCNETRPERIYRFRRRHFGDNCDSFTMQKRFCEYYKLL